MRGLDADGGWFRLGGEILFIIAALGRRQRTRSNDLPGSIAGGTRTDASS